MSLVKLHEITRIFLSNETWIGGAIQAREMESASAGSQHSLVLNTCGSVLARASPRTSAR